MSFFKNKNKDIGGTGDITVDSTKTAIQTTPPTDPTKTLWLDTSE